VNDFALSRLDARFPGSPRYGSTDKIGLMDSPVLCSPAVQRASSSGLRAVMGALPRTADERAVLVVVLETVGSTYRKPGAMLLRGGPTCVGWLSGGCLEAELELIANAVLAEDRARVHDFNTLGDDDLLFGSASGCRGRITLLLLPVNGRSTIVKALLCLENGAASLRLDLGADGSGTAQSQTGQWEWSVAHPTRGQRWSMQIAAPPRLLLLGAGPEACSLIHHAQELGWNVEAVEHRGRWRDHAQRADVLSDAAPEHAWSGLCADRFAAAVVMGHHYTNDLCHLQHLAKTPIGYVGLLGPPARRDALLAELGQAGAALQPRLHAPVGLVLGGEGPESIALAIVADLQRYLAGVVA
jgi:xanthine dehydrogenase accessory factor